MNNLFKSCRSLTGVLLICALLLSALGGCGSKSDGWKPSSVIGESDAANDLANESNTQTSDSTVEAPDAPYGTEISAITNAGIELFWKKPESVDGYIIYRGSKKNGDYEAVMDVDSPRTDTWTDDGFDHDKKTVYYTLRSYRKLEDGSRVYSDFAEPAAAEYMTALCLDRDATYMFDGITRTLTASYGWGEPEDAVWTSSDESVATVSDDGTITGIAKGECTITCSSKACGQSAESKVVVDRSELPVNTDLSPRYTYDEQTGFWVNDTQSGFDAHSGSDAQAGSDALITMVGDMMCSSRQMRKAKVSDNDWNFEKCFSEVRDILRSSDFAFGNLETMLASEWSYMCDEMYIDNENNCNAPSQFLGGLTYAGFDGVSMANNHDCDTGTKGVLSTLKQVDRYKLAHTGLYADSSEKRYLIADINGIRVGFLAYVSPETAYNDNDAKWSEEDVETMLNTFTKERAEKDIAECRADGAEYVIVYMHWGLKNYYHYTEDQAREAMEVAEAGADYIVGANPHLVEEYDELTTEDGRIVPCFYSVGNFLASMDQVEGNRDSVIVRITLTKDADGNVVLKDNSYIPCTICSKLHGTEFVTVPLGDGYDSGVSASHEKKCLKRIKAAVGDKISCYDAS